MEKNDLDLKSLQAQYPNVKIWFDSFDFILLIITLIKIMRKMIKTIYLKIKLTELIN